MSSPQTTSASSVIVARAATLIAAVWANSMTLCDTNMTDGEAVSSPTNRKTSSSAGVRTALML